MGKNIKQDKTNAMRLLDAANIPYTGHSYDASDGNIDGISVAVKLGCDEDQVYKTLVAQGASKNHYVFVIPVARELDLKKAAHQAKEKNIELIPVKELQKTTGYIRGGCSPLGMKKPFLTFIEEEALLLETFCVSAGKIGAQIELNPEALAELIQAQFVSLIKE